MPAPPPLTEVAATFLRDLGLLLARGLAAWLLVIFHAWGEAMAGCRHYFGPKESWPLSDAATAAGLPAGLALATTLTAAMICIAAAFALGLLTRVAAALLLVIAVVIASVASSDWLQETAGAYAAVALVLVFCGPGHFSLDAAYVKWRRNKKKPGPKYR